MLGSPVESTVSPMPGKKIEKRVCTRCEKKHLKPKTLVRMPSAITDSPEFKRQDVPLWLCPYCDDTCIDLAMAAHQARNTDDPVA